MGTTVPDENNSNKIDKVSEGIIVITGKKKLNFRKYHPWRESVGSALFCPVNETHTPCIC